MRYRAATAQDAPAIAWLHAESWRRHYRGAYDDAFLDGDVHEERLGVWTGRLADAGADACTIVAETRDGELGGFAHTIFGHDPPWGALLDNLHVAAPGHRRGTGRRLVELTAEAVEPRGTGLYLWVLEQNVDGQAFYEACGAQRIEAVPGPPPKLRYAWRLDGLGTLTGAAAPRA